MDKRQGGYCIHLFFEYPELLSSPAAVFTAYPLKKVSWKASFEKLAFFSPALYETLPVGLVVLQLPIPPCYIWPNDMGDNDGRVV